MPDEDAEVIGLKPLSSGERTEDEGLFIVQHSYWQETMRQRSRRKPTQSEENASHDAHRRRTD